MIVSIDSYRALTRDNTSPGNHVEIYLGVAQDVIETFCNRDFDEQSIIDESVQFIDGIGYPKITPVTDVSTTGYIANDDGLIERENGSSFDLVSGFVHSFTSVDISYTGGYTDDTAPNALQLSISLLAREFTKTPDSISNFTRAQVGRVSVSRATEDILELLHEDIYQLAKLFRRRDQKIERKTVTWPT